MELIIFYVFSSILVLSAIMMITVKNPVMAAFYLVLSFFATAPIWLLLEAEFLAVTLVLVYVGAVMVLFLFVVMMLDINIATLRKGFVKMLPIGVAAALTMLMSMIMVFNSGYFSIEKYAVPERHSADYNNTAELGQILYTEYLLHFEVAAVILLVAIIAAITLTHRRRANTKHQDIDKQVRVKSSERLKIVEVKAEKRK
ncbi:MAG: NADH-quinone oxidoreductase subunit J [Gammaproteobacteria bacterium]|nr:NADH-quinone oxidoreductase subunit J [Gammaproteobacteria bacterium]